MNQKVLFYSLYERFWHWIQALGVTLLLLTGFEISYPTQLDVLGFENAVRVHNLVGLFLVVNALLALFYNLAAGLIERYIPSVGDVFPKGLEHASYYIRGIFKGSPHPFDKTPDKRLLPLQKVTYFIVLNLLLPLMVLTGLLKLFVDAYPELIEALGGLTVIGPIHRVGAWLFASFLILHVYMTTTGPTWLANLSAMITGYGHVERADEETPR